jgi:enoyl-[acyl-carrier-protein] reductase (NADH)
VGGLVEAMAKQQRNSKSEVREASFVRPSSLMKGFATVDEVATMATYPASELSSTTDGAALRADGGVVSATL